MRYGQYPQGQQYLRRWGQSTWRSLLVGLVATFLVLGLWQQLRIQEQRHLEQLVQQQVGAVTSNLGEQLTTTIRGLERMANRWEVSGGTPRALWEADAKAYIHDNPGFQAINWVDPTFHVRWVVPLAGNESALNFDATQEHRRKITLQVARDLQQTLLTRTVDLVQGGKGFLACVPLFSPDGREGVTRDRFDGFILGVFRFSTLFESMLVPNADYQVEIHDGTHLIYRQGKAQPDTHAKTGVVHTYGADWQVKVFPTPAFIARERSRLPDLVLWGGLALSWLLALAVELGQRSWRQAQRVRQTNQQLQAEIQQREQVEANLRASEERWQLAIRGSNDGIWDWQVPTNEVFFSSRWKEMLGFADDEIRNHLDEWSKRVHPDDLPAVMAAIEAHFAQQTPFYLTEHRVLCKDGSYKWILDRGQALWDEAGHVVRMTGSHTDITERKQTEIALRASEEKYRNLVAHLNAGFIVYNTDAQVVQCNTIACDVLGIVQDDLLGQVTTTSTGQWLREDGTVLPVAEHPVNLVLQQQREIEKYVVGIQKPASAPFWLLITAFPDFDAKGQLQQVVMTFIDISLLKQAEQASARLAAIVASSEDAIIGKTLTGVITSWNAGASKIFGYTADEMIGQPITQLIPTDRLDEEIKILDRVRHGESLDSYDTQRRRKDGTLVDLSITVSPIKDKQGNLIGISKIARDISDRKQAELALKESEARFQTFMQNAPLMVWIVDADGILLYGNSAFLALLNCAPNAAIGQSIRNLFSPELVEEYRRNNRLVIETNSILETIEAIPDASGTQRQYLVRKFPLHHQGQTAGVGGVAFDITERQQAEVVIRQSEERFRQIAETIQDVFFINSPDLKQLDYVSPAYESIWGRSRASLYQNPNSWLEAIYPNDLETVKAALKQQLRGVPFQAEYRIIRPDGSMRWIFSRAFPTFQPTGELQHYIGLASDITERKQAEMTQRALIEAIPDFLVRMRRDGLQLELLNRGAIHLFQPNPDAIPGTLVTEIMPSDIAQERLALSEQALATGIVQTQEYQFELNGEIVYEEARIAPLGTDEVLVVVRDITDRHRSEEALRASEEKFRQLAENIHQVFFILSVSGEILYVSPAYEHIWQRSSDPIYQNADDWLESVHPDDRDRVTIAFHDHIRLQQPFEEIYRILRPDGEIRWISVQSFPLLDDNGRVTRFTGIAEDITQQKQAEAALRQSEATKQAIIEAIPDLLMRMQSDGTDLEFISNTDFNVIHDLSQLGPTMALSDVLEPELAQRRLSYAQRALETGQTQVYEHQIRVDEQWHYEEVRIVPLPQNAVLVMVRNITDRKQAEIDLLREKERFQAIVTHIPIMVTLFNEYGEIKFVNPALEHILGWSLTDWQERDRLPDCYPDPMYRQSVLDHMLAATGQWRDLSLRTASGQQLETSWASVRLSDGRFLGIGQDITDRKHKEVALQQAMEAAEAANMAKSMFLANMSHELRTPLNVILGFTQIMAHDPSLSPNQLTDLETIQRSGDHLLSLINDVLDLSKIEAGHYSLEASSFDLISLLHTLRSMMAERTSAKDICLEFAIAPEVPQFIMADEKKLRQILLNLLSNAVKFTQSGGITLEATAHATEPAITIPPASLGITAPNSSPPLLLQFAITDTGPGIAPNELEVIFDAFVQAEAGRKASSGTGLGLAISRKLLEIMGGTITVTSTQGVGSTFTIRLPVYPATGVSTGPQQNEQVVIGLVPGQPHRRILVVDDQLENRLLIVRLLSQLGLEIREAANGQEAVQLWRDWRPDLIWMDIRMPLLDGYEATKQIRAMETEPSSVIIALTAQASQSDRTLALAAGCDDYISKPFHEATLFLKMAEYLGLEYLYANTNLAAEAIGPSPSRAQPTPPPAVAKPNLAKLSATCLADLEMAAARGDDREIVAIVAQFPPENASLANHLTELAEHYQFEQILELVQDLNQASMQKPTHE